jgi:uncharacterized membrane protein
MAETATPLTTKSSGSGLDPKIAGLLAWIFAPISSIILLVVDKDNTFIKFHSWQSLIWSIASYIVATLIYTVLSVVTFGLGACCAWVIYFLPLGVQIYGAIKAYNGEMWKLPYIGDFAEKQANQ